jgi:hypothetical protein
MNDRRVPPTWMSATAERVQLYHMFTHSYVQSEENWRPITKLHFYADVGDFITLQPRPHDLPVLRICARRPIDMTEARKKWLDDLVYIDPRRRL